MSQLTAAIYSQAENGHGRPWTDAFAEGLRRHGVDTKMIYHTSPKSPEKADVSVFWGMRVVSVIDYCRKNGLPFACLDHGYTADRQNVTSVNLNALNGESELDVSGFAGDQSRCVKHGWEIKAPQKQGTKIIVVGQVYNDKSLRDTDIYAWANFQIAKLEVAGHRGDILFKPHPLEKPEAIDRRHGVKAPLFEGSMEEAFKIARLFCTYSSTTGPSAWLNGIDATAASPVSMIYREQSKPNTEPNRQRWLNDISFRQFTQEEMRTGLAWELLGHRIIGKVPGEQPAVTLLEYPKAKGVDESGIILVDMIAGKDGGKLRETISPERPAHHTAEQPGLILREQPGGV